MKPIHLLAAACLQAAAGCATYEPRPIDPEGELTSLRQRTLSESLARIVAEPRGPEAGPATRPPLFDLSDGIDEAEAVSIALALNPDLSATRLERGEAGALLIEAGLWPNPEVLVGWRPGIGGAPGYSLEADLLIELLTPWNRAARRAAAEARIEEVDASLVVAERRLAASVRKRHFEVLLAEERLRFLTEESALRRRAADLVRRRRDLGDGTALDVAAAELETLEVERLERRVRDDARRSRIALNALLGLPSAHELQLEGRDGPLRVDLHDPPGAEETERRVLAGRFELREKEARYRRAEEELRLAVQGQYPRVKLGPAYGREPEGGDYVGIAASVEIPVFDRNQGEIAGKAELRERLRAEYTALLHGFIAEAHAARVLLESARAEIEAREGQILPAIERHRQLFDAALRGKALTILEWIAAEGRVLRARLDHLEAFERYHDAVVDLESATGTSLSGPGAGGEPGEEAESRDERREP